MYLEFNMRRARSCKSFDDAERQTAWELMNLANSLTSLRDRGEARSDIVRQYEFCGHRDDLLRGLQADTHAGQNFLLLDLELFERWCSRPSEARESTEVDSAVASAITELRSIVQHETYGETWWVVNRYLAERLFSVEHLKRYVNLLEKNYQLADSLQAANHKLAKKNKHLKQTSRKLKRTKVELERKQAKHSLTTGDSLPVSHEADKNVGPLTEQQTGRSEGTVSDRAQSSAPPEDSTEQTAFGPPFQHTEGNAAATRDRAHSTEKDQTDKLQDSDTVSDAFTELPWASTTSDLDTAKGLNDKAVLNQPTDVHKSSADDRYIPG